MPWYDLFAVVYDANLEWLYRSAHVAAADALSLEPGHRVLVPACGTGQDLPHLLPRVQPGGALVGVDASEGMLDRARARDAALGLPGATWLHRSAEDLDDVQPVDRLLWFLGLSVVPDPDRLFAATWDKLVPGGLCAIVDVHAARRVPQTWVVETIARADLRRRPWTHLEERCEGFRKEVLSDWSSIHGGTLFLAAGRKP